MGRIKTDRQCKTGGSSITNITLIKEFYFCAILIKVLHKK